MKRLLLLALLLGSACAPRHPAAEAECEELADLIVALELRGAGFGDAVLERARADQLRGALQPQLASCRRLRLTSGALECARRASSTQVLAHQCLL